MMTVMSWWYLLCAVGAVNIVAWTVSLRRVWQRRGAMTPEAYTTRRLLLILSGIYVFGCAYRCLFLVYDVPRICLFDNVFASVLVGRSVATLAELAFVAQWALILRESSRATGSLVGKAVALALVPLIVIAETCSWFSVLTTDNVGHVVEESLWGVAVALLVVSVVVLLPRTAPARRPVLAAWCLAGLAYVGFMFTVDVPMYWARWIADEAIPRPYLTLSHGLLDVAHRHVVSHAWADWKNEVAWMSLYFSVAVWMSIALVHSKPPLARRLDVPKRLPAGIKLGIP